MAGLVPAIHVLLVLRKIKTWMPATSAGMTIPPNAPLGGAANAIHHRKIRQALFLLQSEIFSLTTERT
jgi:hypothetical protein